MVNEPNESAEEESPKEETSEDKKKRSKLKRLLVAAYRYQLLAVILGAAIVLAGQYRYPDHWIVKIISPAQKVSTSVHTSSKKVASSKKVDVTVEVPTVEIPIVEEEVTTIEIIEDTLPVDEPTRNYTPGFLWVSGPGNKLVKVGHFSINRESCNTIKLQLREYVNVAMRKIPTPRKFKNEIWSIFRAALKAEKTEGGVCAPKKTVLLTIED